MEPRNDIDQILRDKFAGFAPEPREQVWANIKGQMPKGNTSGWYNLLGLAMLGITAGFFILHFSSLEKVGSPVTEAVALATPAPQPQIVQADPVPAEAPSEVAPTPPTSENVAPAPYTAQRGNRPTTTQPLLAQPKSERPIPAQPLSVQPVASGPVEVAAGQSQPKQTAPVPATNAAPSPLPQQETPALQQGENILQEGRQTQRGKLLKKVSEIAEKNLGIDADYSEKQYQDHTQTSFSADLKFFKIKRVKTRKND